MGSTDDNDGKVVVRGQPVVTGHLGLRPNSLAQETVPLRQRVSLRESPQSSHLESGIS